ncbi:hypothetical protein FE156_16190 [Streptomyces albidoflavus]|nr:hypothetical protein FE156_16190 [Streptomyces albidoflavus]
MGAGSRRGRFGGRSFAGLTRSAAGRGRPMPRPMSNAGVMGAGCRGGGGGQGLPSAARLLGVPLSMCFPVTMPAPLHGSDPLGTHQR